MENLVQKFRDGKQRKEVKRNVDHTEKSQHMSNTSSKRRENNETEAIFKMMVVRISQN